MGNYAVIGGSSGIGLEVVGLLAAGGHRVYATYHQNERSDGEHVTYHALNVLEEVYDLSFLPDHLDGMVYCPGSINLKPFSRFSSQDFLDDFNLNAVCAARMIQQLLPKLKAADLASVVLFSSVAVQQGFSFHAQVSMSKGAVEGLTRALAAELAPHIRVNAIAPSLTQTSLASALLNNEKKIELQAQKNPLKKIGQPKDIAHAAVYLLSPESSWVTAQVMHIDGGFSALKG